MKELEIVNRKASLEYSITETVEAGVVLTGAEVKSLKLGRGSLSEAFARIKDGEAWVHNLIIPPYQGQDEGYDPAKARKLLLHRKEIISLSSKIEGKNAALVPLKIYIKGGYVKILLGLGKGKRQFERREEIKKRDIAREAQRDFKVRVK